MGCTVLAPNSELAAALSDAVERLHVAAGHDIWSTARIRDFNGWLRDQHARRQLADGTLPRCLSDLEERELWRVVIRGSAGAADYLEPSGAARGAQRARRAIIEHGIPWAELDAQPGDESVALLEWNRRFELLCRERDCIAADQLLTTPPPPGEGLAFIESPIWRPVARDWLRRAGARMLLAAVVPATSQPLRLQAASPDEELAAAAEWARTRLHAGRDFRAWICIPDLALRRRDVVDAFDAALAAQRFSLRSGDSSVPYAIGGGTPLADFPPVRAALGLLSAAHGALTFEAFSTLLRSPEWHASPGDACAAAKLDVTLRTRGASEATLRQWLGLGGRLARENGSLAPVALQRLGQALEILEQERGAQPLSRWVAVWVRAFEAGPWAERGRWSSSEYQAAQRCRELLAELAAGDGMFGSRSAGSAIRLLQRAARDTPFQSQTGIPPIWVSGQVMDPWLTYDAVWIAGCGEDRWPPPIDPVPLIPVPLQRKHGLLAAGADTQLELAALLQSRWRLRAAIGVYSCADAGDGRAIPLSPLVPPGPLASTLRVQPQPHWHALAARAPTLDRLDDTRAPPFGPGERTHGVATLRAQSLCPFRGLATRLDAARLERPTPGFNRSERGTMVHDALDFIWSELRTSTGLAALTSENRAALIDAGVGRAIRRQCERRDPGERWRRREGPRLGCLLEKWLQTERMREPFEVERLEQDAEVARHGGLEFNIRIDRMDRLPADGGRVLIDYKTGAVKADWRGDRPDNPQLPLYALLHPEALVAVAYGKVDAGESGFVAEAGRDGIFKPRGKRSTLEGQPDFAALVGVWSRRIDALAGEFAAGHAAVSPTLHACGSCHLQSLCRIPSALAPDTDVE